MSWDEYNDMYERAQLSGQCHLYIFDLKGSKEMSKLENIYDNLHNLLYTTYRKIQNLEKERGIKILHTSEFLNTKDITKVRGDTMEPVHFMGDLLVFTTIRCRITSEEIYKIFTETKKELGLEHYQFHFANGYYETDDYTKGDKEYFRGYCIAYLDNKAKNKNELI